MNRIFNFRSFRRIVDEIVISRPFRIGVLPALAGGVLGLCLAGCGDRDAVTVQLQAHPLARPELRLLEIRAQVTGPQAGLTYKWFSVVGECDPQESGSPTTTFKFADGGRKDRVSVEVWRDNERIAQGELDVTLDGEPDVSTLSQSERDRLPAIEINITNIPPYDPDGGPETHADIGGTVRGALTPDCKVVIYARAADLWFIQPEAYKSHSIRSDSSWSTWTHTGSSYAALVVRPGFDLVPRLDVLPPLGGYVLARTNVLGVQR